MEQQLQAEAGELGHYELVRKLGEGGFGEVVQAWDARLERHVAIKRLKSTQLSARPGHLLDEARMAASLRHPAFVRIFSIDGDTSAQSIVMEYVEGSTLRQLAQGGPLPEAQVRDIVGQVAAAMAEAHAANLVHGDLKPSNLMLDAGGAVRILDFGLASRIDPDATQSTAFDQTEGTVAYLAPELLLGSRQNPQSDIYALGVVAYELLTGARPFAHLNGLALAAAHIQSSSDLWVFPPEVSASAAALVRAMTARDLGRRFSSMGEVGAALAGVRQDSAPLAAPARRFRLRSLLPGSTLARWSLAVVCGVMLVAGAIQTGKGSAWLQSRTPFFSEAAAMQAGMAALKNNEADESIDTAIAQFSAVLARKPQHAAAAAGLSIAYCQRHAGDRHDEAWLQRADASAQLALKLDDQLALAYTALANVRLAQGKDDEALRLVGRALNLDPRDVHANNLKAITLIYLNRFDEAGVALAAAIKAQPNEANLQNTLGMLKFTQGDYPAADLAYRRSIALEPGAALPYSNLSGSLLRQGRGDEALQVLQQGLQVRPRGDLYATLGNTLFNRGDYVGAAKAFENAVSSSKGNSNTYLHWANLGDTLRWIPGREDGAQRAYREAVGLMKPLLERAPSDVTLTSRLGLYYARLGEHKGALERTVLAVAAAPGNADVHFRAAMAYELSGHRDKALAELQMARERGYPANLISAEPDLIALRRDPRFHQPTMESTK
jgi:tetratricopeptide (TPR) repeat protein